MERSRALNAKFCRPERQGILQLLGCELHLVVVLGARLALVPDVNFNEVPARISPVLLKSSGVESPLYVIQV